MLTESEKVVNPPEILGEYKNTSGGPLWLSFLLNGENSSPGRTVQANGKFEVALKSLVRGVVTAWIPATATIQKLIDKGAITKVGAKKVEKAVESVSSVSESVSSVSESVSSVSESEVSAAAAATVEISATSVTVDTADEQVVDFVPDTDTETTDTTVSEVLDSREGADSVESEVVTEEIADVILTATPQPLEDNVLISWTNGPADTKFAVVVVDPKEKSKTIKAGKSDHVIYVPQGVVGKYEVTLTDTKGTPLATTVFVL